MLQHTVALKPRWSQGSLIAFRFFFTYFIFYIFPFPLIYVPYGEIFFRPLTNFSHWVVNEIAKTFFDITVTINATGSGDTTFDFGRFFLFVFYSCIITICWSFVDRQRDDYEKLLYWLLILLRYYLAATMMLYGFFKIFKTQFPFPSSARLNQTYGESSPMGLLWTFMGYSTPYNFYIGLSESIGGFLLFFRRTRLLGSLIVAGVMSHVVMLNFAYDVPVKLFSLHLFAITIFLIVSDIKRLAKIFLWNEPCEAERIVPVSTNSKIRVFYRIGKWSFIIYLLTMDVMMNVEDLQRQRNDTEDPTDDTSLVGEFEVRQFVLNDRIIPADSLLTQRWKKIQFDGKNASIHYMDDAAVKWLFHRDFNFNKVMLISTDLSTTANFRYTIADTTLTLEGSLYGHSMKIVSTKKSSTRFLLTDRGFHWITEFPFNR
jgi:hypothetical protein